VDGDLDDGEHIHHGETDDAEKRRDLERNAITVIFQHSI
jgi:hypothetical protein